MCQRFPVSSKTFIPPPGRAARDTRETGRGGGRGGVEERGVGPNYPFVVPEYPSGGEKKKKRRGHQKTNQLTL